eukprot:TRINITY_DN7904_c0_g1_i1.p1 TRINITY_DN7904_c0_g1~~TRINITY_DN7904_c0_g1_i1.p1  ORF type:complete len:123 (-),score=19.67 TRINITY_DN7904_c0_g1_i1:25-393(-)
MELKKQLVDQFVNTVSNIAKSTYEDEITEAFEPINAELLKLSKTQGEMKTQLETLSKTQGEITKELKLLTECCYEILDWKNAPVGPLAESRKRSRSSTTSTDSPSKKSKKSHEESEKTDSLG